MGLMKKLIEVEFSGEGEGKGKGKGKIGGKIV